MDVVATIIRWAPQTFFFVPHTINSYRKNRILYESDFAEIRFICTNVLAACLRMRSIERIFAHTRERDNIAKSHHPNYSLILSNVTQTAIMTHAHTKQKKQQNSKQ